MNNEPHTVTGLLRDGPFRLFLSARTVSGAGYAITAVALPLIMLELTGSALVTSLVAAIEVVPYLAFGLIAGALADRMDRRRLMLSCQLVALERSRPFQRLRSLAC
ncbi:MAG: MFS transporter [Nocardioides sp.]